MNFKELQSTEKLRGGYYTPSEIAAYLLRWVMLHGPKRLLEPSCGDGVFFTELAKYDAQAQPNQVIGFEVEPVEANKAAAAGKALSNAPAVHTGDFLGWALLRQGLEPRFDAVVGNPPFIRYQYLEPALQEIAERIFAALHLRFTKHTNAWVPFVVASLAMLRPGGRLAMVVPAEILHVLHAEGLRGYLARECANLLVIDPEELWFEGLLQGAVLLLAEKKRDRASIGEGVAVVPVRGTSFLTDHPEDLFRDARYVNGPTGSGKWMWALLSERERSLLKGLDDSPHVRPFGTIAEVDVGIVTGANKFFLVPDAVVEEFGLARWAHPMFGRSEHVPGVIYDDAVQAQNKRKGLPTNFLWFSDVTPSSMPAGLRRYITGGESDKLHTRYKCRIREPWYLVPSVYATSVGMLKRSHDYPRLILNEAKAFTTDTAYRITSSRTTPQQLVGSFVNSLTALSAEMEGRHYGGGVLELVPSEIERLRVPFCKVDRKDVRSLDRLVRGDLQPYDVLRRRDELVLAMAGLMDADAEALRDAWWRLRCRRQRVSSKQVTEPPE